MNSLEFIESFIKHIEEEIEYYKKRIEEEAIYPSLKQCHELELESAIKGKETLHQIKTKLEAWEVVKKNIVIDTTGSLYTIQIYKQDEECKTFEKALEVKE